MAARAESDGTGQHDWTAFALLTLTMLCWSGNTVLIRYLHEAISPAGISFWRTVFTVALLLPFIFRSLRAQLPLLWAHRRLIFWIGITQFTVGQLMLYCALQTTTAVNAGLILGVQPVLAAVLAWTFFGERLGPARWFGVALALVGVIVIIVRADFTALAGLSFVVGDIWAGVAVVAWAVYAPFVRRLPPGLGPFVVVAATTFTGGLGLLPAYLAEIYVFGVVTHATWETLAIIGYVAVFGTVFGVVGWNIGITRIGAGRASTFLYLIPVITVALGVAALGEAFHLYHAAGMALVLVGVAFTNRARPRAGTAP